MAIVGSFAVWQTIDSNNQLSKRVLILYNDAPVGDSLVVEQDWQAVDRDKFSFDVLRGFSTTNPAARPTASLKFRFAFNGTNFNWDGGGWAYRGTSGGFLANFERTEGSLGSHDTLQIPPLQTLVESNRFTNNINCQLVIFDGTKRTEAQFQIRPKGASTATMGRTGWTNIWNRTAIVSGLTGVLVTQTNADGTGVSYGTITIPMNVVLKAGAKINGKSMSSALIQPFD